MGLLLCGPPAKRPHCTPLLCGFNVAIKGLNGGGVVLPCEVLHMKKNLQYEKTKGRRCEVAMLLSV